jgi:ABC-type bacteriocin/lantibiotic exporter with double-glycine peptidase domain
VKTVQRQLVLGVDGIVGKNTMHALDEFARHLSRHVLSVKPPLVRQVRSRDCWAAAIESLTKGRFRSPNLLKEFALDARGLFSTVDSKRLASKVGMIIVKLVEKNRDIVGRMLLSDLKKKHFILLFYHQFGDAHAVVIYGVDGISGKRVFAHAMDPAEGYGVFDLGDKLSKAGYTPKIGRLLRLL